MVQLYLSPFCLSCFTQNPGYMLICTVFCSNWVPRTESYPSTSQVPRLCTQVEIPVGLYMQYLRFELCCCELAHCLQSQPALMPLSGLERKQREDSNRDHGCHWAPSGPLGQIKGLIILVFHPGGCWAQLRSLGILEGRLTAFLIC